jgi:hypothetical protein
MSRQDIRIERRIASSLEAYNYAELPAFEKLAYLVLRDSWARRGSSRCNNAGDPLGNLMQSIPPSPKSFDPSLLGS